MDLAEYLFRRIQQLGIRTIHGVPGDYILAGLDHISRAGLLWKGNVNELEAGYAADGFARVAGISALVTTFGVGELSAINALAGAYAESVPIIHIVGAPPVGAQRGAKLMHHTLGNGDYAVFKHMAESIASCVVDLAEGDDPCGDVDEALEACVITSKPVFIYLPVDLVAKRVKAERLTKPLDLEPPWDQKAAEEFTNMAVAAFESSKRPAILVGHGAMRQKSLEAVRNFVANSQFPTFVTPMGKGAIDEAASNFSGLYQGSSSSDIVRENIEASDLLMLLGVIPCDYNTGGFTEKGIHQASRIKLYGLHAEIDGAKFEGVPMRRLLPKLSEVLDDSHIGTPRTSIASRSQLYPDELEDSGWGHEIITHHWLWPTFSAWLQEKDVIITETGTSNFGICRTRFPDNVVAINQWLWGSIGYALGACEGAALAVEETNMNRTLLFTGDGSFQLTSSALSAMLRYELKPIIFVIRNKGFTIERHVHGWKAAYNDIQSWNFLNLPAAYGAENGANTYSVKTRSELQALLKQDALIRPSKLQLVEVWMPWDDAPESLKRTGAAVSRNAAS